MYALIQRGCSLNIVLFKDFGIYSRLWPFLVFPRCLCEQRISRLDHQMASRTPALQQNWQSSEKSKHFKEKHNIQLTPRIIKPCVEGNKTVFNVYGGFILDQRTINMLFSYNLVLMYIFLSANILSFLV